MKGEQVLSRLRADPVLSVFEWSDHTLDPDDGGLWRGEQGKILLWLFVMDEQIREPKVRGGLKVGGWFSLDHPDVAMLDDATGVEQVRRVAIELMDSLKKVKSGIDLVLATVGDVGPNGGASAHDKSRTPSTTGTTPDRAADS